MDLFPLIPSTELSHRRSVVTSRLHTRLKVAYLPMSGASSLMFGGRVAAAFGGFGPPLFGSYETHCPVAQEFWTVRSHVYAVYRALVHVYYLGDRYAPLLDRTLGMTGF